MADVKSRNIYNLTICGVCIRNIDILIYHFNIFKRQIATMKQAALKDTVNILHKIESIEREVLDLKLSILKDVTPTGKRLISLKGILKGIDVNDKDIASAKKSLYSKIGI